jgi:hypothetical protein
MTTKCSRLLFCSTLALGLAAPALAWQLNDSEEPGSVLVFPSFEKGTVSTPDQGTIPRTNFVLSVTCPKGSNCVQTDVFENGQKVFLKGHWVCQGDRDGICAETDFNLSTTVFGTLVFNTENIDTNVPGGGIASPDCSNGYAIVWVVDEFGRAIKFDGLIGHEVDREDERNGASAVNALPIQAGEALATGDLTTADTGGNLAFDGDHYKAVTGTIFGGLRYDSNSERAPINTEITLLTLDVHSGRANDVTDVGLNFFSEREKLTSTTAHFSCSGEFDLTGEQGLNNLAADFPDWTDRGHVESYYATQNGTGVTLVGFIKTQERFRVPVPVPERSDTQVIDLPGPVCILDLPTTPCRQECIGFLRNQHTRFTCTLDVPAQVLSVLGAREYAYELLNDSTPVQTTFEVIPPIVF